MKRILGFSGFVAALALAAIWPHAQAEAAEKPYAPPVGQRMVQGVWNGVEYVYEGDWVPEFIYKPETGQKVDDPNSFDKPGDWRGESRPGYRARPTPQSVEFYRYIMKKSGEGKEINMTESYIIRKMIENRTWPEAPTVRERDRGALNWANQQNESEDSSVITDPVGWSRRKNADIIYEEMTRRGRTEEDTPPTEGIEKFRKYWQSKTPEEKKNLPLGRWMKGYLVRKGYDMRSDEERADDEAYEAEQEQKRQAAEAAKEEAERDAEEKAEQEAQRQQDWFKDKWAEEDRRIAAEEARERLEKKIEESRQEVDSESGAEADDDEVAPEDSGEAEEPSASGEEVIPDDEDLPSGEEVVPDDETEADVNTVPEEEAEEITPDESSRHDRNRTPYGAEEVNPGDEDETESEEESETEVPPEAGTIEENPDGGTTTTKGWVEGTGGSRITLTETRNPDGSVITTTTETDRDGNIINQTTYGESGEGQPSTGGGLRGAEAGSDAEVNAETASGGVNTSGDYSDIWSDQQSQRGTQSSDLMGQNSQMEESANVGNEQVRQAQNTRNRAGNDASATTDAARRKTLKNDRENSWGKAIGDGVESGITEGGKAFGSAFGGAAADVAVGKIFGPSKEDTSASGSTVSGAASSVPASSAATGSSGSGNRSPKTKPKKKPQKKPAGSSGGGSTSGGGGQVLVSTENDIPLGGESLDNTTRGGSTSRGGNGHCPKCGRTDLVEHVYESGNMIVHDWRCPSCDVTGVPGPPPANLGSGSVSSSGGSDTISGGSGYDDDEEDSSQPCSGQTCGRCGYCPCRREAPGPGDDHIVCWFVCPKCGWRIAMSDGSGL